MKLGRSEEERRVIWLLMCTVEDDIWNAILWQLVRLSPLEANPFYLLLSLYTQGVYPLGLDHERFVIGLRNETTLANCTVGRHASLETYQLDGAFN